MKSAIGCAALLALITSSSLAQVPATAGQAASASAPASDAPVAPHDATLPIGTEILLSMNSEINSTDNRQGDTFPLSVVNDIRVGDQVVIPRGTRAVGEITWRTGRGAFGKSGKMDVALRYIDLNGVRLPIEGTFRQEGNGATVATLAGVVAVGIFAGFITGHRATIPSGRELLSHTSYAIPFTVPGGQLSSHYDAAAAFAAVRPTSPPRNHSRH
jgi:hypothetical protein